MNQTAHLKSQLYSNDLIYRLNNDLVDAKEQEAAKGLLVRLALLRTEKTKRGLENKKVVITK
jgi:hypothetical protein